VVYVERKEGRSSNPPWFDRALTAVEAGRPPANGGRRAALPVSERLGCLVAMIPIELLICRHLGDVPTWKRVAFMAACCEPMLLNYRLYQEASGYGSVQLLRKGLDLVWRAAETSQRPTEADLYAIRCMQQSPGWLNRGRPFAEAASQACFAISHSLKSMDDPALPDAIDVSDAGLYSIEWFYRNELKLSDQELEDRGELIRREHVRQTVDLEILVFAASSSQVETSALLKERAEAGRASLVV